MASTASVATPCIGIVGGGMSGALLACHLRRDHPGLAVRIVVIEPRAQLAAGLAYDTDEPEHRLNIPASRTVIVEERPEDFLHWVMASGVAARDPQAVAPDGQIYPRRGELAAYARHLLDGLDIEHRRARASGVTPEGDGFRIALSDGTALRVDHLALASGHPRPCLPAALAGLPATHCIADPAMRPGAVRAIAARAEVVVLGTGLTACDVAAVLAASGHRGPVTMVSRRGLLPRRRTLFPEEPAFDLTQPPATTARALLRRIRDLAAAGGAWELAIDAARRQATTLWRALPLPEKRRLLRHARVYWDVHRFLGAPQIDARLDALAAAGRLRIEAGTLCGARLTEDGRVALQLQARRAGPVTLSADVVVNCTGPAYRDITRTDPLLAGLAAAGILRADPCGLGLDTDADGRLRRADGGVWPNAWVLGPLARYAYGELMGLPQISFQPRDVARRIAAGLARDPASATAGADAARLTAPAGDT